MKSFELLLITLRSLDQGIRPLTIILYGSMYSRRGRSVRMSCLFFADNRLRLTTVRENKIDSCLFRNCFQFSSVKCARLLVREMGSGEDGVESLLIDNSLIVMLRPVSSSSSCISGSNGGGVMLWMLSKSIPLKNGCSLSSL